MATFLERLNSRVKQYLSRLFCLPGSIVVTGRPGNDTPHGTGFKMGSDPASQVQPRGLEFQWHTNQSMKVKVRVEEAPPPEGYLRLLQVLRKQI
jgi:hypothetical protein